MLIFFNIINLDFINKVCIMLSKFEELLNKMKIKYSSMFKLTFEIKWVKVLPRERPWDKNLSKFLRFYKNP